MKGIIIDCEALYFSTFRKPASTSLLLTFTIPPFTTIRGMIANAMGLQQHDHSLQNKIKIGIRLLVPGYKNTEMAKILKLKESKTNNPRVYPSSPMFKEFLVNPQFRFYIAGEKDIIELVRSSLINWNRPLYLGQSDDLVDITVSEIINLSDIITTRIDSLIEGVHPECIIENLPYKFNFDGNKYQLINKLVSIPIQRVEIQETYSAYQFKNDSVCLY